MRFQMHPSGIPMPRSAAEAVDYWGRLIAVSRGGRADPRPLRAVAATPKKTPAPKVDPDDDEEEARLEDQPEEPKFKPKKDKKVEPKKAAVVTPLSPKALAKAVATALAAPAVRREVRAAEREHRAIMTHLDVLDPGVTAAVERDHVREAGAVMTKLAQADHAAELGLSPFEQKLCAEQGVTFESYARAKASRASGY